MFGWLKRKLRRTPSPQYSFATGTKITDNLATGVRSYVITEDIPMKFRRARDLDPAFTDLIQSFCTAHPVIRSCWLFDVMYPPSTDQKILIAFDLDEPAQLTDLSPEFMFLIQNRPERPRTLLTLRKSFQPELPNPEFYRRPTS